MPVTFQQQRFGCMCSFACVFGRNSRQSSSSQLFQILPPWNCPTERWFVYMTQCHQIQKHESQEEMAIRRCLQVSSQFSIHGSNVRSPHTCGQACPCNKTAHAQLEMHANGMNGNNMVLSQNASAETARETDCQIKPEMRSCSEKQLAKHENGQR